jgi:hypothetical protein
MSFTNRLVDGLIFLTSEMRKPVVSLAEIISLARTKPRIITLRITYLPDNTYPWGLVSLVPWYSICPVSPQQYCSFFSLRDNILINRINWYSCC